MKKHLSDEQLDRLMRSIVSDASVDEASIDEIADSPTVWWAVQRAINHRKDAVRSPWPPAFRRWSMIGVPLVAAFALVFSILTFRSTGETTERAGMQQNVSTKPAKIPLSTVTEPVTPAIDPKTPVVTSAKTTVSRSENAVTNLKTIAVNYKILVKPAPLVTAKKTEIKSDFIALSYARNPESGQIVRVKVPSSMMVTLGLVSSVQKPSALVEAEVVVGDDGTTHAIRFIR